MFKKLFFITTMLALTLSACGGNQATAEATTPAPTESQPVAVTNTPAPANETPTVDITEVVGAVPTQTPEATATPPRPANEPGCVNKASFVSDVTIPDNTVLNAGQPFTKTWRISNTGTCIWAWDYKLTYYSETRMDAPDEVPLDVTYPGQTTDISVNLVAPSSPGTYRGNFVIENPEGLIMQVDEDSRLWLIIQVENTAPTATPTTTTNTNIEPTNTIVSSSGSTICSFTTDVLRLTDVINAVNAYRAQNGLANYTVNTLLVRAAQAHANDMACNNNISHTGSDGSTPESRVAAVGYVATDLSENIYGSYPPLDGQGVVNWWAADTTDPRHKENLLSTTFTEIGVGYSFYNNYGYYVIVFAKP